MAVVLIRMIADTWLLYMQCMIGATVFFMFRYHDELQTEVVDGVIEDIRLCLEAPLLKFNQRRIAMVKYLAELYYYHMIETGDILKTLYLLITLGNH